MSNSNPLVSILINNFNKEKFCERAVKSAINQDYKKIEIIFYDDCSSDGSVKIIESLKNKRNNIKIIKNKKRSNIFSLNQLNGIKDSLKACKGKFVCILDSDDFFKKNKIRKVVDYFKQNKLAEIVFDHPIFFHSLKKKKEIKNKYFLREIKWPRFPPTSCISFKKQTLKRDFNKICYKNMNELWFDFRISTFYALKKKQFNLIQENLTYYRQNSENFEKRYIKFINSFWWKRRYQAFLFLKKLDKKKFKKNIFTIDYLITLIINKIFLIN